MSLTVGEVWKMGAFYQLYKDAKDALRKDRTLSVKPWPSGAVLVRGC